MIQLNEYQLQAFLIEDLLGRNLEDSDFWLIQVLNWVFLKLSWNFSKPID